MADETQVKLRKVKPALLLGQGKTKCSLLAIGCHDNGLKIINSLFQKLGVIKPFNWQARAWHAHLFNDHGKTIFIHASLRID